MKGNQRKILKNLKLTKRGLKNSLKNLKYTINYVNFKNKEEVSMDDNYEENDTDSFEEEDF